MSELAKIIRRRESLEDIYNIMGAMKNLATIEAVRTGRYLESQQKIFQTLLEARADFEQFFLKQLGARANEPIGSSQEIAIVLGSERGFCGDFNNLIYKKYQQSYSESGRVPQRVLVVGQRLAAKVPPAENTIPLEGASTADEVESVLDELISHLQLYEVRALPKISVISGQDEHGETKIKLARLHEEIGQAASVSYYTTPPQIHLPPAELAEALQMQMLVAFLRHRLLLSLEAENLTRVRHMESARQHIEGELEGVSRSLNAARQEEITEEIEVILLSVQGS